MADGFLGRWSKRKLDLKDGKPVEPEPPVSQPLAPAGSGALGGAKGLTPSPARGEGGGEGPAATEPAEAPPLPTLDDVAALTPESDYSPFTARNVAPEVRNAAMKKLFTDPHYNVMDRLDIYIDDYSQPDPMSPEMLRQLVSAKFLGLFEDEEKDEAKKREAEKRENTSAESMTDSLPPAREDADDPTGGTVAQSDAAATAPAPAVPAPTDHADPDLRLQPNDAPPGEDPGGRA